MKTHKKLFSAAILCVFASTTLFFSEGCKKYEDGPALSLRTKTHRVVNTWKIEQYLVNDTNVTDSLRITSYKENYNDDGSWSRSYIVNGDTATINSTGTWAFANKKEELALSCTDSVQVMQGVYISPASLKILRLKEKELWYSFEKAGKTHELHLVSQ